MQKIGNSVKGYELKERIGTGGFGAVYRAYQSTVGREVAIKFILPGHANEPEFIRRFEAEAQLIARLEHPYIVPLYDFWREPEGAYLVMRWLRGGSLHDLLSQQGAMGLEDTVSMLEQLSQALHTAHRGKVIHRDIKPGNILLDEDGNAYLADFGIAKDHALTEAVTNPEAIIGSPDYLAPEQARSEAVTPQTDIYSMGVVIYQMLAGEHPFPNLSPIERLYKHLNDPLPDLEHLDDNIQGDINDVIQKATAKDPQQRFSDAIALAQALREAAGLDRTPTSLNLVELLTPREQDVLKGIIEGKSNREIAEALVIEVSTVKWYCNQIYRKLNVRSRVQAIVKARELDLIVGKPNTHISTSISNLPEPENPYKGLQAFQAADAQHFFGRERLIQKLLGRLQEDATNKRFLAVVGPSGSGKSSVVKGGLIPALWRGDIPNSDNWYIVDMLPGERPLDELEVALTRIAGDAKVNIHEQLERDSHGLQRVADLILPDDGSELLIIIDQFEEVFTLLEDEESRIHFLHLLKEAVNGKRSRVRVLVTLRADYYDKPLQYPDFGELIRTRIETVLPLGAEELEQVIHEPARQVGVNFEDGLVSRIVADVHYQPGALPLLQYALTELFERREGRTLTQQAYQEIGGTGGALANRADELFNEGSDAHQELIRQMFLRLVTLGEGAEDTRRRVNRVELLDIASDREMMEEIIDVYADSRLLSLDNDPSTRRPTVEVAHEAILREWERLRIWLNDSRDDIRQERDLARATADWDVHNRDASYLLHGTRLEEVEAWQSETQLTLTQLENYFIETSLLQREAEADEKSAQIEHEKAQETRALASEKRSQNFLRALVAVFALATVLSGGLSIFAFIQRNNAVESLDVAQRSGLAFAANSALEIEDIDLAIALAMESVGDDESDLLPETLQVLERLENRSGQIREFGIDEWDCGGSEARYFQYFFFSNCADELAIWDLSTFEEVARIPTRQFSAKVRFSPDGTRLLLAYPQDIGIFSYELWSLEEPELITSYDIDTATFAGGWAGSFQAGIAFTNESSSFITPDIVSESTYDSTYNQHFPIVDVFSVRDVETGEILHQYQFEGEAMQYMVFSDDGTLGVASGWSGFEGPAVDQYRALVFDTATGDILHRFDRPHEQALDDFEGGFAGFSTDGTKLFIAGNPSYAIDIATGENYGMVHELDGYAILSYPDPNFEYVINFSMGANPDIQITNILTGAQQLFQVNRAYFTPLENTIITAEVGGMDHLQVWDINPRPSNTDIIPSDSGYVSAMRYSPDGSQIVVVHSRWAGGGPALDSSTTIRDAETLETVLTLNSSSNHPWGLDWSPDGRYIATGAYQEVILWDATTGEAIHHLTGTQDLVQTIHFTPNSRYLIATHGTLDRFPEYDVAPYLVMWDVETGEEVRHYEMPVDRVPNWGIIALDIHPTLNIAYVLVHLQRSESGNNTGLAGFIIDLDTGETTETEVPVAGEFTPDGKSLIGFVFPNDIYILDAQSGQIERFWETDDTQLLASALSDDGRYLFTGTGSQDANTSISMWDIESETLIRRFSGHNTQSFILHIEPYPDGSGFISAAYERAIRFWNADTQSSIDWIRENRMLREFTCSEREVYRIQPLCNE